MQILRLSSHIQIVWQTESNRLLKSVTFKQDIDFTPFKIGVYAITLTPIDNSGNAVTLENPYIGIKTQGDVDRSWGSPTADVDSLISFDSLISVIKCMRLILLTFISIFLISCQHVKQPSAVEPNLPSASLVDTSNVSKGVSDQSNEISVASNAAADLSERLNLIDSSRLKKAVDEAYDSGIIAGSKEAQSLKTLVEEQSKEVKEAKLYSKVLSNKLSEISLKAKNLQEETFKLVSNVSKLNRDIEVRDSQIKQLKINQEFDAETITKLNKEVEKYQKQSASARVYRNAVWIIAGCIALYFLIPILIKSFKPL